jgi:hypothetical protein
MYDAWTRPTWVPCDEYDRPVVIAFDYPAFKFLLAGLPVVEVEPYVDVFYEEDDE